jgi:hypothetical protein
MKSNEIVKHIFAAFAAMATESANTTRFSYRYCSVCLGLQLTPGFCGLCSKNDYRCALMVARLFQFNEGWDKGARSPEPPNFSECHAEMETVFHIFQMRALAFATNAGSHSRCRRLDEMCEISGRIGFHGVVRSLWTERKKKNATPPDSPWITIRCQPSLPWPTLPRSSWTNQLD